jgi:Flp pilus assembly pilin Flp
LSTGFNSPDFRDHQEAGRLNSERGQGLVEYGLILCIMAVVSVVSLVFFGDQLSSILSLIASAV